MNFKILKPFKASQYSDVERKAVLKHFHKPYYFTMHQTQHLIITYFYVANTNIITVMSKN